MFFFFFLITCVSLFFQQSHTQQTYINNNQLDCYIPDNSTNGYLCNAPQTSCLSYLTFRSQPPYDSATTIGNLLNSNPSTIAKLNNITDVDKISIDTLIIVPITNCSCSGKFYQYNSSYTFQYDSENYFTLANDTYQGLTTCQALINQNPKHDSRNLYVGIRISVPLRCVCPTKNQTVKGVKFLLSYLVTWGDYISSIGESFGVDEQSTLEANELTPNSLISPFTPILVPLKTQPSYNAGAKSQPPPQAPIISVPTEDDSKSTSSHYSWKKKRDFIGIGISSFLLLVLVFGFSYLFFCRRPSQPTSLGKKSSLSTDYTTILEEKSESTVISSENVRHSINPSMNVYNFEDLQRATGYFQEDNRIKGSVYRGVINGENAAIKRMTGDALNEINILKQINHLSVVKLSSYCMHEGNAYFVYEFAENGSLSDWLHDNTSCQTPSVGLAWKQRIQIAYDVADGLNYLHNYATPTCIHMDLKSSNILLDGSFRAKIANFGVARTVDNEEEEQVLQLTRHVVGTQGYMPPEYMENGVITPKMDVFAFGVVMLELLSGKEAMTFSNTNVYDGKPGTQEVLLFASINKVLEGENVREKLKCFIDPSLSSEYPLELAFSMALLAKSCVAQDLSSRPTIFDVCISLSKLPPSPFNWDPSDELQCSSNGATSIMVDN